MHELLDHSAKLLEQAQAETTALKAWQKSALDSGLVAKERKRQAGIYSTYIDQLIWMVDVDVENVEDMYQRRVEKKGASTIAASVASLNSKIFGAAAAADLNSKIFNSAADVNTTIMGAATSVSS